MHNDCLRKLNIHRVSSPMDSAILFPKGKIFERQIMQVRALLKFMEKVELVVFNSLSDVQAHLGKVVPPWFLGTHKDNTILILNDTIRKDTSSEPWRIITHEFVHIVLKRVFLRPIPLWLNEGLAMHFSGQTINAAGHSLELKKNIYEYTYSDDSFYALCIKLTGVLIDRYGLLNILEMMQNTTTFESDSVFGSDAIGNIFSSLSS
jgi:hypothetical protein